MKLHFYGADRCVTGSCHCLEINGKRIDVYKRQAQECVEDYLTFDTGSRSGEFFALRVRGESMLGVGILPDDLVVVRRQQTANNGEIVVALIGDEATVKTFKKQNGEIWLLPANPDYQPIDGRECEVLGKVVAVVRQY